jgi:hypothetical protein
VPSAAARQRRQRSPLASETPLPASRERAST